MMKYSNHLINNNNILFRNYKTFIHSFIPTFHANGDDDDDWYVSLGMH